MKKILSILLGCMMCLGVVTTVSANDNIDLCAQAPTRETETSETFRGGTGQWFYMKTTCDAYTNKTELINYEQFKNITLGYYLDSMNHATRYRYSNNDVYVTTGKLRYTLGGPINGWDINVRTQHFFQ